MKTLDEAMQIFFPDAENIAAADTAGLIEEFLGSRRDMAREITNNERVQLLAMAVVAGFDDLTMALLPYGTDFVASLQCRLHRAIVIGFCNGVFAGMEMEKTDLPFFQEGQNGGACPGTCDDPPPPGTGIPPNSPQGL